MNHNKTRWNRTRDWEKDGTEIGNWIAAIGLVVGFFLWVVMP